ncbi:MAG: nucleoside 2-deoxyribosyltransferase [Candidatus Roizmanbacteria bacterium]
MIIYFTASVSKKDLMKSSYLKIVEHLMSQGQTVIAEHILDSSEEKIRTSSTSEHVAFQKKVENWIEDCHCIVAETSHPAVSVGYEIGLALNMGKPILILHQPDVDPPSLFGQHHNENVVTASYTRDTLGLIIGDFLHYVEDDKNTKFTFFMSPKHTRHLDKVATKHQIPKSTYLRGLIDADMQKSRA